MPKNETSSENVTNDPNGNQAKAVNDAEDVNDNDDVMMSLVGTSITIDEPDSSVVIRQKINVTSDASFPSKNGTKVNSIDVIEGKPNDVTEADDDDNTGGKMDNVTIDASLEVTEGDADVDVTKDASVDVTEGVPDDEAARKGVSDAVVVNDADAAIDDHHDYGSEMTTAIDEEDATFETTSSEVDVYTVNVVKDGFVDAGMEDPSDYSKAKSNGKFLFQFYFK